MKSCGECFTIPSLNFAYLVFAKQMAKVKRSFLCIRFGETKIGLNVNLFHVIGPTSGSVSTVLFTPWPIGIVNITLSLKLTQCTYLSRILTSLFWQNCYFLFDHISSSTGQLQNLWYFFIKKYPRICRNRT